MPRNSLNSVFCILDSVYYPYAFRQILPLKLWDKLILDTSWHNCCMARIAFIDVTVTVSYGGLQTAVWRFAETLTRLGHEVHVYGGVSAALRHPRTVPVYECIPFRSGPASACSISVAAFSALSNARRSRAMHAHQ